jgi:hypothetical protein
MMARPYHRGKRRTNTSGGNTQKPICKGKKLHETAVNEGQSLRQDKNLNMTQSRKDRHPSTES